MNRQRDQLVERVEQRQAEIDLRDNVENVDDVVDEPTDSG